ncbi:TPA: ankyrin repeat domain-containing protein [Stenotrophomonas maltophilia]|nr:ankyrin repeat domain-containing protein [Stenotrophomonas maltophilia]
MPDNNDSYEDYEEWEEDVKAARQEQLDMEKYEEYEKRDKVEQEKLLKQHALEAAIEFTQQKFTEYGREIGFELIKGAIANGASADGTYLYDDPYTQQDDIPGTPYVLSVAEINQSEEVVKYMIDHGANINGVSENDRTLLHTARTPEFVDYLMENGFGRLDHENELQHTAMHEIIQKENVPVAKRLVDHGLGLTEDDKALLTNCDSVEMVQFLIDQGADVNQQDYYGNTALHNATARLARADNSSSERLISVLLENGADPEAQNIARKTPRDYANEKGKVQTYDALLQQHQANSPTIAKQKEYERDHSPSFSR